MLKYIETSGISKNECTIFILRKELDKFFWGFNTFYPLENWKFINYKNKAYCFLSLMRFAMISSFCIDKDIRRFAKDSSFLAFIPHMYIDLFSFVTSHPMCSGFVYVEEGDASYCDLVDYDPMSLSLFKNFLFYRIATRFTPVKRLGAGQFYPKYLAPLFTLSYELGAFKWMCDVESRTFSFVSVIKKIDDGYSCLLKKISKVVVLLVAFNDVYPDVCKSKAISYLEELTIQKADAATAYFVSFHPALRSNELVSFREKYIKYISSFGWNFVEYEGVLERLLVNYDVVFVGANSSLKRYNEFIRVSKLGYQLKPGQNQPRPKKISPEIPLLIA